MGILAIDIKYIWLFVILCFTNIVSAQEPQHSPISYHAPKVDFDKYIDSGLYYLHSGGSLDSSFYYYNKAENLATSQHNILGVHTAQYRKVFVYYYNNELQKYLKSTYTLLPYFKSIKEYRITGELYNLLSIAFFDYKLFRESNDCADSAYKYLALSQDSLSLLSIMTIKADILSINKEYDKAIEAYESILKLSKQNINTQDEYYNSLSNLGVTYKKKGLYTEAYNAYLQVLKFAQQKHYVDRVGMMYDNLAALYLSVFINVPDQDAWKYSSQLGLKNTWLSKSEQYYKMTLQSLKQNYREDVYQDVVQGLSEVYSKKGQLKLAQYYSNIAIRHKDSVDNQIQKGLILNVKADHEIKAFVDSLHKESNIIKNDQEAHIQSSKWKNKVLWTVFGSGALILILLLLIGYKQYSKKKEQNIKHVIASNLDEEVGLMLKNIHSIVDQIKTENKDSVDPKLMNSLNKISEKGNDAQENLNLIMKSLNASAINADPLEKWIRSFAQSFFEHTSINCNFDFKSGISDSAISEDAKKQLVLVVKEALNNVYKHSKANLVTISSKKNSKNWYLLTIIDNGVGIYENNQEGNGMRTMATRIHNLGGTFSANNSPQGGTIIKIEVPFAIN